MTEQKNVPLLDLKAQYATIKEQIRVALDQVIESQLFTMDRKSKAWKMKSRLFAVRLWHRRNLSYLVRDRVNANNLETGIGKYHCKRQAHIAPT